MANLPILRILPQPSSLSLSHLAIHSLSLLLQHQWSQSNFSLIYNPLSSNPSHLSIQDKTYIQCLLPRVSSLIYHFNPFFSFRPYYKLLPLFYILHPNYPEFIVIQQRTNFARLCYKAKRYWPKYSTLAFTVFAIRGLIRSLKKCHSWYTDLSRQTTQHPFEKLGAPCITVHLLI